jgi:hypothetical protein
MLVSLSPGVAGIRTTTAITNRIEDRPDWVASFASLA